MTDNIIEIQELSKFYQDHLVLHSINLSVRNGEFLTLLGPSGCGKTTLLRLISGFEQPSSGKILIDGYDTQGLTPQQRHVNTVFQNYALFPHMTVFDNVAFGLRCQNLPVVEIYERVMTMLETVHLSELAQRKPEQLSGGQQQRVAIARAAVNRPLVLLLDEPMSALDYRLRKNMQIELKQLQRELGITFILVTHDQEEALSMSDRIVLLNNGTIEQVDTPRRLYEEPTNLTVAKFIGEVNIFDTAVDNVSDGHIDVVIEGEHHRYKNTRDFVQGDKIHLLIRPEDLRVWSINEKPRTEDMFPGTVEEIIYKGKTVDLMVRLDSGKILHATEFFDEDDEYLIYNMGEKVLVNWIPNWEVILPHEQ